jgi:hypothetical protein
MYSGQLCIHTRPSANMQAEEEKTVVLKLDFRKAFDTVSWDCLHHTLVTRGFDQKWISWMSMLTSIAKTVILLNGIPGPWIPIKRGLRQGDPLFPFAIHSYSGYPSENN